jgi:putative colanic acid biosynthesis glycosyltransferase
MTVFSIVTINWNDCAGLQATYRSVASQTYRAFRWIVIDGASTDGSLQWLQALDEPLAEIISEPDQGIYDAMNKGLALATEQPGFTLFLNSGDCLSDPGVLARVATAVAQAPSAPKFIYGDYYRKAPSGALTCIAAKPIEKLRRGMPSSHQCMYFENARLLGMKYRENYKLSADYCLLVEFLSGLDLRASVLKIPAPLCIFDTTGVSERRRLEALREDMQIRMRFMNLSQLNAYWLYLLHYLHTHSKWFRSHLQK